MSHAYKITVEAKPTSADIGVVVNGLTAYNASQADGETPNYLFITLRGENDSIVGGMVGATYLGWLSVQAFWVDESLRGLGYGKKLMETSEQEALRRGCPRVFLETLSFQALPFYEKCGYVVFSRLDGFPPGGCRYALTKQLAAPE